MLENLCRVLTFHERRAPNELSACALSSLFCLPLFVLQCSQIGQGFCCEVTQFLPSLWGWPSQASPQDAARGFGATEPRVPCAWGDSIWERQCGLQQHAPGEAHLPLGHRWLWSPEPYCLAASLLGQKKQAPCFLLVSQNNRAVTLCCCNGGWMDCCGCQGWGKERRGGTGSRELGAVDRRGHGVRQLEETWQG